VREKSLPDIDWVLIPGGPFIYQDGQKRAEPAFYIARYPITYAQFQTFIDDPHGFANLRWWKGLAADDEHRRAPGEQAFKLDNHPRERVSWYDAAAFCRWLTEVTRAHPQLFPEPLRDKGGCEITLPTEWQWEKAARGALPSPEAGYPAHRGAGGQGVRAYPYGKTSDAAKANTRETGIGQTSAVGIFPNGTSPYGVFELSGNVWEWCLNEDDKPTNIGPSGSAARVVRGGSWLGDRDVARATFRNGSGPGNRSGDIGFRVCVRPPDLSGAR
jgi:formylglycine-generating enzyme required for sulfatase activity